MNRRDTYKISVVLTILASFFSSPAFTETYTDESINEIFGSKHKQKIHGVMAAQLERLHAILDGFLIGDPELIQKNAVALEGAMREIVRLYPSDPEDGTRVWAAMSEIMTQSQAMKNDISNNDYQKAYTHYTRIAANCIQCHQVARSWSKFEEPTAEAERREIAPPATAKSMTRLPEAKPPAEKIEQASELKIVDE